MCVWTYWNQCETRVGGVLVGAQTPLDLMSGGRADQEGDHLCLHPERSKATAVALGSFPVGEQAELSLRLGEPLTIISE